jgi:hypothetical protein
VKNFQRFITNPDYVREALTLVGPAAVAPLEQIDRDGDLEQIVGWEWQFMRAHQPNLVKAADYLTFHLRNRVRLDSGLPDDRYLKDPETLAALHGMRSHIITGFVLGAVACAQNWRPTGYAAIDYRDISASTLAPFEEEDGLKVDMMLDALDANTAEGTARLRYTVGNWMDMERGSPKLEEATVLGAVACYALLDYQNRKAYKDYLRKTSDLAWQEYQGPLGAAEAELEQLRRALDSIPAAIRYKLQINDFLANQ